jgi:hypothetical protein
MVHREVRPHRRPTAGSYLSRGFGGIVLACALACSFPAAAQIDVTREQPCCDVDNPTVVWIGDEPTLTFAELAAYCAPILWFSPDEPLLDELERPAGIDIPMAFPFEEPGAGPVVYYRVRNVVRSSEEPAVEVDPTDRGRSRFNLDRVTAIDLDYFFYYPSEEGLGGHTHDVESVEMKVVAYRQPNCTECRYGIVIALVNAKAHGIRWYDNTLETDEYTRFPITILVEEGKHASCTDKNGDGYFTPAYDVNKRVNDAWGVRDVMRTGTLFTGGFQSWLAKVRHPKDRVFPPLPPDSRARARWVENGVYAPDYRKYELRPYPRVAAAEAYPDHRIVHFVDKGYDDWPESEEAAGLDEVFTWFDEEDFAETFSIALRIDDDLGFSVVFPLFVFKNFNEPIGGGWLVNRIYLKDSKLRDFGWNVMYTPSASRWIDGYFSLGLEVDKEDDGQGGTVKNTAFATETGIKFRGDLTKSPLKFMTALTSFWGLRVGVRYKGYAHFNDIGYVVEIGAGAF